MGGHPPTHPPDVFSDISNNRSFYFDIHYIGTRYKVELVSSILVDDNVFLPVGDGGDGIDPLLPLS